MQFPEGKNVTGNHPFSAAILEKSLNAVFNAKREVTGFLRICCGDNGAYFLFFLKNSVHAAARHFDHRSSILTIKDFFTEVVSRSPEGMIASIHETDPMLIEDFLIFFKDEPTLKAPVGMIDLDAVVRQIAKEQSDSLVILEAEGFFNFFNFQGGKPVMAHFSDTCDEMDGLSIDEQMLLYAYRPGKKVDAYTYRNVVTRKAADSDDNSHSRVLTMLHDLLSPVETVEAEASPGRNMPENSEHAPSAGRTVKICITEGVDKGANHSLTLPFTVGRKEGELIIADPLISRRHAVVREISGSLVIEDLGSTNGTFVNGVEIKLQQLANGDTVKVGSSVFQILLE